MMITVADLKHTLMTYLGKEVELCDELLETLEGYLTEHWCVGCADGYIDGWNKGYSDGHRDGYNEGVGE